MQEADERTGTGRPNNCLFRKVFCFKKENPCSITKNPVSHRILFGV